MVPVFDCSDEERVFELLSFATTDLVGSAVVPYVIRYGTGGIKVIRFAGFDESSRFMGC